MNRQIQGLVPPIVTLAAENIAIKGNVFGTSNTERAKWAEDLNLHKNGETIFFAGCGYQDISGLERLWSIVGGKDKGAIAIDPACQQNERRERPKIDLSRIDNERAAQAIHAHTQPLRDAVKVLHMFGIDFGYLAEDEPCCGGPLYFFGLHTEFNRNAKKIHKELKSLGVRRIISMVPSCTYTLRNLISDCVEGYELEIRHWSEVVSECVDQVRLQLPEEVKVTYHDPCLLSRYLRIIEQPRKILRAIEGVELIEPERSREEWTTCCGGGGGFQATFPELGHIIAMNRVKELVETGAEIVVTQCPACISMLRNGLEELKVDNVGVVDLAEIVARAMGPKGNIKDG